MASTNHQRCARVRPALGWKHPGLPTDWVRVLERHLDGVEALPDYVWLDTRGKVLHVLAAALELREGDG